jgi:hypothetical protein
VLIAVVAAAEIVVVVVAKVVAGIISILVAVGRGGDYLETSSGSSSGDYFSGDLLLGVCPVDN